ncbi:MAG: site-specific DNA-methyltransferase [Parcubacteria group bacterium]|nr:site-specific DNA-methyltransferase [Parcubacteria group bacterium]
MINYLHGDCRDVLKTLDGESVHCCVTSPPYWGLRDYGVVGQLGLEKTPEEYVQNLLDVFTEVMRVLRRDGTLWLNLGDSYSGSGKGQHSDGWHDPKKSKTDGMKLENGVIPQGLKPKDLVGIPWRVAFALQSSGWFLRCDIIWSKPNPMPESVLDRPTRAHEYIFLLTRSKKYYYDHQIIMEDAVTDESRPDGVVRDREYGYESKQRKLRESKKRGEFMGKTKDMKGREAFRAVRVKRNKRSVWEVASQPYADAHFAVFPSELIRPCILAGCPDGGTVLDPFAGSGTTGLIAEQEGRNAILIELNDAYIKLQRKRTAQTSLLSSVS